MRKGSTLRASKPRRTVKAASNWPVRPPNTASTAASFGSSVHAQMLSAHRLKPKLPVLYMTGFTRNAVVHNVMLDPGVHLIPKPFTVDQLAAKVREILDQVA